MATDTSAPPAAKPAENARWVTTLQDLSDSQIEAIRALPPMDDFTLPKLTARRPASLFTARARFELERDRVFRRLPVPITVGTLLAQPGMVMTHTAYGLPLLLVRGKDGTIRVFLNACRHKGAKLVEQCAPHKLARLTCPYHSWTYGLDGRLLAIAREDVFDSLDKGDLGLVSVPAVEFGGLIWAILDKDAEADFSSLHPQLGEDLDRLGLGRVHVYDRRTFDVKANWKLVMEPFQENYHVKRLHASSIGSNFEDGPAVIGRFGRHQRKTYGNQIFTPEALDVPGENIHKLVAHIYQLFPNGILITSPYYMSLMILAPQAEDRTSVEYFMLTPTPPSTPKLEDLFKRSYDLICHVFGNEDYRAAEISQEGLQSGALDEVIYGGMEYTIPAFYDRLDACLVDDPS